ncbi:MAG: hypothetical protein EG826_11285 [Deltaproteobacteria bacterium]|nr:hypothetical protein [Deltaproteobacteria bacterium]
MKKAISCSLVITFLIILNLSLVRTVIADDQDLFTQGSSYAPNILIILDNSQSMDEDFVGNLVGPWAAGSRLVEAKRAIQQIVTKYNSSMRIGLMTYQLGSVSSNHLHNAVYFSSYEPKSYCPNPPPECSDYCVTNDAAKQATCQSACVAQNASFDVTYRDEILTHYAVNSEQRTRYCNLAYPKTQRYPNPSDLTNYIYYKLPGTYYSSSDAGNAFCYSRYYDPSESGSDTYRCFTSKTGTSDDTYRVSNPGQYGGSYDDYDFTPTDEDIALGFKDFGRRLAWYHVGRTWFRNSSPGGGYLQIKCNEKSTAAQQLSALLAKLDMKENNETAYMSSSCSGNNSNSCPFIIAGGLTPTAGTLQTAIDYFKGSNSPIQDSCQKNFVIFVTDGLPSVNASGQAGSASTLMPAVLDKIDALRALTKTLGSGSSAQSYTFNVLTYVVGMAMTPASRTHLDTMASHGGTAINGQALYADNASQIYTSLDNVLSDILTRSYAFATSSISSSRTADENFIYEATFEPVGNSYPFWKGFLKKWSLKADGSLDAVVWEAGSLLKNALAENRNMQTLIGGSLTKFQAYDIDSSNYVPYSYLNVADQPTANKIIKYVRGYALDPVDGTTVTNPDNWKLGDVFHSSPITLGTPTPFFNDTLETNPTIANKKAFEVYRDAHPRASNCSGGVTTCPGYGKRMIVVGANDGQFHAFNATNGAEFWSFVPPNLLPKLQYLAHYTTTSTLGHQFFVDGRITATDAWLPSTISNGTNKSSTDWRTLVMFSLGRNDRDYTAADKSAVPQSTKYWSSSSSCDAGITEYYNATTAPYYCGYYAFDFTDSPTSMPTFKWTLQPGSSAAPFLGEPWSAISIGRVKIAGNERWIGVIGGGYNANTCTTSSCSDKRGKGIIAFDLRTGQTLWSYTWNATDLANVGSPNMGDAIASQVSLVDGDYDGYLDHGYVGDIKGNMWQIKFCTKADLAADANCGTSNWKGSLLLDKLSGSDKYPIYFQPTVTRDSSNNTWIFWSSGDQVDPTGSGPAAYVYALKPLLCKDGSGNPSPCSRSDLKNITSDKNTYCGATTKTGWYINLSGKNEQVLSQPVAFNNILYFTSFIPASGSSASCTKTGTAQLYAISIESTPSYCNVGAGYFTGGSRFIDVGAGIASGVLLSYNPDGSMNAYVTVSGAGGQEGGTLKAPFQPPTISSRANMLYWKDLRIQ